MSTYNPETDKSVVPFEQGDIITLEGAEWEGHIARVVSVEWYNESMWLVTIITDTGVAEALSWYDCNCHKLWGKKC